MIDVLTGQSKATGDSKKHGIIEGMIWLPQWCCGNEHSVWGDDPPCHVCPNQEKIELTTLNQIAFNRWKQLDKTGRTNHKEFLNESSIDANLKRYGVNEPEIYERILQIEEAVFQSRLEEIKQEQKRREKKNGNRPHKNKNNRRR